MQRLYRILQKVSMPFRANRLPFRAQQELPYCVIALLPY
jgi:hypothetical protein